MSEERLRILNMIKAGTITPEEGLDLLEALKGDSLPAETIDEEAKPKFLKVKVLVNDPGEPVKVNVNIPVSLIKLAAKFMPKEAAEQLKAHGVELDEVIKQVTEGVSGKLVDIQADEVMVEVVAE